MFIVLPTSFLNKPSRTYLSCNYSYNVISTSDSMLRVSILHLMLYINIVNVRFNTLVDHKYRLQVWTTTITDRLYVSLVT